MTRLALAALAALTALAAAAPAYADVKISDRPYVRHDGGTDPTIAACSSNNRQQNEPAATVAPHDATLMTAGANDYCTVETTGDSWAGFYYSSDGGTTWTNSLLPGYPTDTSAEGQASPLHGLVTSAGDPVQEWDNVGHVYYGGIAFNRTQPANGSIWLARYRWQAGPQPDYEFTTIVSRGASSPLFIGNFEDKVQLGVDRGATSPHSGNVYMCWTRFNANPNANQVFFARSTDGGRTFSKRRISGTVEGSQFCDIAVTKNGTVYVAWRQFEGARGGQAQPNAVVWVKSTNGGQSFTQPREAAEFLPWDLTDHYGDPVAAGRARYEACLAGDTTPGACRSPEPRNDARDCGDGPFACQTGYVFHRAASQVRITADPRPTGNPDAVYVVYDATVPGSETPTGTSYGTLGVSGTGSQAAIYFIKTTNGGGSWTVPQRIDPQATGHQFFPDIAAEAGQLHAVWQDSRNDCASGPPSTPSGGDFRTVPIANRWEPANPPGGTNCEPGGPGSDTGGVDAVYATSSTDGASWTTSVVSTALSMPQYEQFGDRDVPFFGDYNYVAASGATVLMDWTDERDAVPGVDPRYPIDGVDGFDVFQTRECDADGCGPDTTPNAGGLDQNIYGAVLD
jgi:hypothetical protein